MYTSKRRRTPVLYLVYLALCPILFAQMPARGQAAPEAPQPPEVQAHIAKGYKYLQREKYAKAIEELETAQELAGGVCSLCLKGIGRAHERSGRLDDATRIYEELFAARPASRSFLNHLVRFYDQVGTPEKSLAAYQMFLESSEEYGEMIEVYNELGFRRLTPGSGLEIHRNEAAAAFRAALDLADGRSNLLRRNLAMALWRLGSKEDALTVLDGLTPDGETGSRHLRALELNDELRKKEWRVRVAWEVPSSSRSARRQPPLKPRPPLNMSAFVESTHCSREGLSTLDGEPLAVDGEVRRPEKVSAPQPQYTEAARKQRIQGAVVVRTIIGEGGCVLATQTLEGPSDDLIEQAAHAIRQWRFRPATLHGQPVAVYYDLTVDFRLR